MIGTTAWARLRAPGPSRGLAPERATANSPGERLAALAFGLAVHAALILLLLAMRGSTPPEADPGGGLSVLSLEAAAPAQSKPPPAMPSKLFDQEEPLVSPAVSEKNSDAPAGAGNCATLDKVVQSLLADRQADAAVLSLPPEARSIADAVVIWNAGWSEAANTPTAPLAAARASVEQSLSQVPDPCLDEPLAGPRLVPIPAGAGTMFLVFGSGEWTWRQLVEPQAPVDQSKEDRFETPLEAALRSLLGE